MAPRTLLRGPAVAAVVVLVVLSVVAVGALLSDTGSAPGGSAPDRGSAPATGPAPSVPAPVAGPSLVVQGSPRPATVPSRSSGLATVTPARLPVEARRTLARLDDDPSGGAPFPDRERLLPRVRTGCYRAYAVPGGDRLVVTSCAGSRYWSADGGARFARIVAARL